MDTRSLRLSPINILGRLLKNTKQINLVKKCPDHESIDIKKKYKTFDSLNYGVEHNHAETIIGHDQQEVTNLILVIDLDEHCNNFTYN